MPISNPYLSRWPRATRLAFARSDYTVATTTRQQALTYTGNDPLSEFVILLSEIELIRKK